MKTLPHPLAVPPDRALSVRIAIRGDRDG